MEFGTDCRRERGSSPMTAEELQDLDDLAPATAGSPRQRIPSSQARPLLIETCIAMLREEPFDEVTVRHISQRAGLNPSALMRNFGSIGRLFEEVCDVLLYNWVAKMADQPNEATLTEPDLILRTRLRAWLLEKGSDPQSLITAQDSDATQAMLKQLKSQVAISDRTASAYLDFLSYGAEGYILFSSLHPQDEAHLMDLLTLTNALQEFLPEVEARIGWSPDTRPEA